MAFQKERMSSYVDRGNKLIADGKMPEAMKLVEKGLQHYSEKIISAISPYAKADAGLIVLVLHGVIFSCTTPQSLGTNPVCRDSLFLSIKHF